MLFSCSTGGGGLGGAKDEPLGGLRFLVTANQVKQIAVLKFKKK